MKQIYPDLLKSRLTFFTFLLFFLMYICTGAFSTEPSSSSTKIKKSLLSEQKRKAREKDKPFSPENIPLKKAKFPKRIEEPDIEEIKAKTCREEPSEIIAPEPARIQRKPEKENFDKKDINKFDFYRSALLHWLEKNYPELDSAEKEKLALGYARELAAGKRHAGDVMKEIASLEKKAGSRSKEKLSAADTEGGPIIKQPDGKIIIKKPVFSFRKKKYPGEPSHKLPLYPVPVNSKNISFMSKAFPLWLELALRQETTLNGEIIDWSLLPRIKNRYGRLITPRMFVMAIIMIESLGVHKADGKIYSCGNYQGFMQLLKNWHGKNTADPEKNLIYGVQHLWSSIYKVFVLDRELRAGESPSDKLIMAGVLYNRGNYSSASKMTWKEILKKTKPLPFEKKKYYGADDLRMGVLYGLKLKAFLGLRFTSSEKSWLLRFREIPSFEEWCDSRYSQLYNALIRQGCPYEP